MVDGVTNDEGGFPQKRSGHEAEMRKALTESSM